MFVCCGCLGFGFLVWWCFFCILVLRVGCCLLLGFVVSGLVSLFVHGLLFLGWVYFDLVVVLLVGFAFVFAGELVVVVLFGCCVFWV